MIYYRTKISKRVKIMGNKSGVSFILNYIASGIMKNTIARYFSVDKGIQEISIGVREKNGEKIAKDITKLSVETLLNLANLTKKN